jgi:phenylalanyl-tRNA synthetase alpha chain
MGKMKINDFKINISHFEKNYLEKNQSFSKSVFFGKKGFFNQIASSIREIENIDKKEAGILLNQLKKKIEKNIDSNKIENSPNKKKIDLTLPAISKNGHLHPITKAIEEISSIFEKIGFVRVRHPEVDNDWFVFESLNMPPNHPARDEWETFFIDKPKNFKSKENLVLTTHTSNGQVREMMRLKKPPIRMINISRCYRRQQDVTHTQMFHQFEGLVIDKNINITHLKGTLDYFAEKFYGPGTKSRIRPFHFQFTEPSFEVDFSCHICNGTGYVEKDGKKTKCRFCKSGWHEVGGAGMVHPNVLKAGNIDPEKYSGFAFGWGVERTYTLRKGLKINDIRLFYNNNLDFLKQF